MKVMIFVSLLHVCVATESSLRQDSSDPIIKYYDEVFPDGVYNPNGTHVDNLKDYKYCVRVKKTEKNGETYHLSKVYRVTTGSNITICDKLSQFLIDKVGVKGFEIISPQIDINEHEIRGYMLGCKTKKPFEYKGAKYEVYIAIFRSYMSMRKFNYDQLNTFIKQNCPKKSGFTRTNNSQIDFFTKETLDNITDTVKNKFDANLKREYESKKEEIKCELCDLKFNSEVIDQFYNSFLYFLEYEDDKKNYLSKKFEEAN
ncbi:hypothetical protein BDAP_001846 [Binucleata daphniae]